jgi:ribosomal protein S18 acetylase RimI-like enzyme
MSEFSIRQAIAENANLITNFIKHMVVEMENYGGYKVNKSADIWNSMESDVSRNCKRKDYLYLLAIHPTQTSQVYGVAVGNIEHLENLFVDKKRLHISAIYTVPEMRHQGIARKLLNYLINWGHKMNASEADLHVLTTNPAMHLYEQLGFEPQEISMIKKLESKGQ